MIKLVPKLISDYMSLKNIKTGVGHDLAGYYADIYVGGKKVGYVNDDGYGGGVEIQLPTDIRESLYKLCASHKVNDIMFANGWSFMSLEDITPLMQLEWAIEKILNEKEDEKIFKKRDKDMLKGIVTGNPDEPKYNLITFTGVKTLHELINRYGADRITDYIKTKITPTLKENEEILNKELLSKYGVTV